VVLDRKLLDYIGKPDKTINVHAISRYPIFVFLLNHPVAQ
jgi:hypothetical protein